MSESTTPNVGASAYNKFSQFSDLSYNCIKYMMNNNEMIWKLLKYNDTDAWKKPNLTQGEKAQLIYSGQSDTSQYTIFMDSKQPDVQMKEISMLRIHPNAAIGMNRTVGYIEMAMEVFSHYKINHLSNYRTRIDLISQELLGLFNGVEIGGLGLLTFDKIADQSSRLFQAGQIPFGGTALYFSTYSAA